MKACATGGSSHRSLMPAWNSPNALISRIGLGSRSDWGMWTNVTWSWIAFFTFMGIANWYVAFHYPLDTCVNFKVWGGIGLFVLFAVAQGAVLARYVVEEPTA